MLVRHISLVLATLVFCGTMVAARQYAAPAETSALARGWSQLAQNDAAGAARTASDALARNPSSSGALTLLVDAELARGRSPAAISAYTKWVGDRRLDNAYVLRRIARAVLVESSTGAPNTTARIQALKALADDGDDAAAAVLNEGVVARRFDETRALAASGDERAVQVLIAQLQTMPGAKGALIDALGDSGSSLPVPHLMALLADTNDINRAEAVDALARLGATQAVPALRRLLNDPVFSVRLKAAGALFRLNDSSGLALLNEVSQSEHAGVRLAAAREMASQPDSTWQSLIRSLTEDPDPSVRVEAAKLLAPYDHSTASEVLHQLMRDDNIAIREAATQAFLDRAVTDFAALRTVLLSGDPAMRVAAATRILELTR